MIDRARGWELIQGIIGADARYGFVTAFRGGDHRTVANVFADEQPRLLPAGSASVLHGSHPDGVFDFPKAALPSRRCSLHFLAES